MHARQSDVAIFTFPLGLYSCHTEFVTCNFVKQARTSNGCSCNGCGRQILQNHRARKYAIHRVPCRHGYVHDDVLHSRRYYSLFGVPLHHKCALKATEQAACIRCFGWGTRTSVCSTRAFPVSFLDATIFLFFLMLYCSSVNSRLLSESGGPCECSEEKRADPDCVFYDGEYEQCVEMFRRELVTVDEFAMRHPCKSACTRTSKTRVTSNFFERGALYT